jgi:hypothetical protein
LDASRSSTNSPCELLEAVQQGFRVSSRCHQQAATVRAKFSSPNATSSQRPLPNFRASPRRHQPPAARAKFSSQSNTTVANFRVSPRPLRTAPTKIDWRATHSYKQL